MWRGSPGTLCSIQEKLPTVVLEPWEPHRMLDEVLTYLAAPEMGKQTPCLSTERLCSEVKISCNALGRGAATEGCCPLYSGWS